MFAWSLPLVRRTRNIKYGLETGVAVVLVVVALMGCAGQSDEMVDSGLAPGERRADAAEVNEKIKAVRREFQEAEKAFSACVDELGYDYKPRVITQFEANLRSGHLPTQRESAQQFGYGIIQGEGNGGVIVKIEGGNVPPPQAERFEEMMALGEGCAALYYFNDPQTQVSDLRNDIVSVPPEVVASDRVQQALGDWADCMDQRGYLYATPQQAFEDIERRYLLLSEAQRIESDELAQLLKMERQVASADYDCSASTLYPAVRQEMA